MDMEVSADLLHHKSWQTQFWSYSETSQTETENASVEDQPFLNIQIVIHSAWLQGLRFTHFKW